MVIRFETMGPEARQLPLVPSRRLIQVTQPAWASFDLFCKMEMMTALSFLMAGIVRIKGMKVQKALRTAWDRVWSNGLAPITTAFHCQLVSVCR